MYSLSLALSSERVVVELYPPNMVRTSVLIVVFVLGIHCVAVSPTLLGPRPTNSDLLGPMVKWE